jgi:membrane protease YdiL (CAAX protease family)
MQILIFLVLAFLPALISGPLPAMLVFKMASGLNWRRQLLLAFLLAIILNLIAFTMILSNLDGFLPSGAVSWGLTLIVSIATLIVSLCLLRRKVTDPDINPIRRKWMRLTLIAIPVLQILMITTLLIIAPSLCNTGFRTCTDW